MVISTKSKVALYVHRSSQQWIVRDPNGDFWVVPVVPDAWDHRQPFEMTKASELEPVPRHYRYLLELPFQ